MERRGKERLFRRHFWRGGKERLHGGQEEKVVTGRCLQKENKKQYALYLRRLAGEEAGE